MRNLKIDLSKMSADNKIRIFVIIVSLFMFFAWVFSGCAKKPIAQSETLLPPQQLEKQAPVPWKQNIDENITVGDFVNFYNEYKIIVAGEIPVKIQMYRDGKVIYKDSSINFDFSVPKMTQGEIINIERKLGKPVSFTVKLDVDEHNYNHVFYFQPDKSFTLGSKVTIFIEGDEYTVPLAIEGDGSGKCRIMYYPTYEKDGSTIVKPASGVPDIIGTKIIKRN